jgi:hypothetical protein
MLLSTSAQTECHCPQLPTASPATRSERLMAVFGLSGGSLPRVDERTLVHYHAYLTAHLSWPFTAYYPHPTTPDEMGEFRCRAVELLHPVDDMYDEFDGLFCRVRKGKYEVNLPLVELELADGSLNSQLIEDYWHWFSNCR